jgi:hypothetical protein
MRWWLAGAFALITALTAVLTATVSSRQVDRDVRANAREIAIGQSVSAGFEIERAIPTGRLDAQTRASGARYRLALFVFAPDGRLIASTHGRVRWEGVPERGRALATARAGRRFVDTFGTATLVALPLRRTSTASALVA